MGRRIATNAPRVYDYAPAVQEIGLARVGDRRVAERVQHWVRTGVGTELRVVEADSEWRAECQAARYASGLFFHLTEDQWPEFGVELVPDEGGR